MIPKIFSNLTAEILLRRISDRIFDPEITQSCKDAKF